jgi:hypothetical protein
MKGIFIYYRIWSDIQINELYLINGGFYIMILKRRLAIKVI